MAVPGCSAPTTRRWCWRCWDFRNRERPQRQRLRPDGARRRRAVPLNNKFGVVTFPRAAKAYLDDWSSAEVGWLRKFYPPGTDEPHFDATPSVEKAIAFLESMRARTFIGTKSGLTTLFELLRQMVFGAQADPQVRLAELRRRREELDAEIAQAESGSVPVLDPFAQRDRYQQFTTTARELLADFREVEATSARSTAACGNGSQAGPAARANSSTTCSATGPASPNPTKGRSFQAFYDFLLSSSKQAEFADLLQQVQNLQAITEPDARMRRIHQDWLDAGEHTQANVRLLSELKLRRRGAPS